MFTDPTHEILLSAVSVWEISVKHSLGKLPLPTSVDRFVLAQREMHGISVLPLEERAVFHLHKLPSLHRDPFDRMLICQAIEHDCVFSPPIRSSFSTPSERSGKGIDPVDDPCASA